MNRTRVVVGIVGLMAVVSLAGCGDDDTPARTSSSPSASSGSSAGGAELLVGTSWTLASYQVGQRSVSALPNAPATLTFNEGDQLAGSTGCNTFGGGYTVNGSDLTLTIGAMTQKACDPGVTAQEAALNQLFPVVASFTTANDTLSLQGPQGDEIMSYTAASSDLAGTSWQVTGVNNGNEAVVSTSATEQLTAKFGDDGTFSGFGGCNNLSGPYESDGTSQLTIGPLASTNKTCGDDADKLEAEYSAALGLVDAYDVSGNTLTMRDESGATQVSATKA